MRVARQAAEGVAPSPWPSVVVMSVIVVVPP